jgi:hypothetical protein
MTSVIPAAGDEPSTKVFAANARFCRTQTDNMRLR